MKQTFLFQALTRIKSESPVFFVKIQYAIGSVLALAGGGMLAISTHAWTPPNAPALYDFFQKITGYLVAPFIGSFMGVKNEGVTAIQDIAAPVLPIQPDAKASTTAPPPGPPALNQ